MAARKKAETKTNIELFALDMRTVPVRIVGDTPLIAHAWSEKAKREMLETQMQVTKTKKKEPRRPFQDFVDAAYWITEKPEADTDEELQAKFAEAVKNGAKWGFPVTAIKQAANSAAYRLKWYKSIAELRGVFFLQSEYGELAEIKGGVPKMREDMTKIGQGTADLRYRPMFENWSMELILKYNASAISLEQLLNNLNAGGQTCGIGEWRCERDGDFGMFHLEAI